MLYSQTIEGEQINFFRSMLRHVLNGELEYKNLVNPVIENARALADGTKNYFTVNRDSYHVIVYLAQKDGNFFRQLNTDQLTAPDYQRVDTLLAEQRQFSFAE